MHRSTGAVTDHLSAITVHHLSIGLGGGGARCHDPEIGCRLVRLRRIIGQHNTNIRADVIWSIEKPGIDRFLCLVVLPPVLNVVIRPEGSLAGRCVGHRCSFASACTASSLALRPLLTLRSIRKQGH